MLRLQSCEIVQKFKGRAMPKKLPQEVKEPNKQNAKNQNSYQQGEVSFYLGIC